MTVFSPLCEAMYFAESRETFLETREQSLVWCMRCLHHC